MTQLLRHIWIWIVYAALLVMLPSLFDSPLGISLLNQIAIAIIFALSYNMLLGQGGMLSFGHAVYFGLGGFLAVHALRLVEAGSLNFSITLIPLLAGLSGLAISLLVGSFSTRRAGTVFAMISLGIAELVLASSLIFVRFFGGEAGMSADRTLGPPLFGIEFLREVEVYYLAAAWVFVATLSMYLFTGTPAGRLANAVRDNPERAEFIGYSARWVRFISFSAAGFFAGIAGGLFALNSEFMSNENLNAATSASVLLMVYIGGLGYFVGPMIGAVILTLMTSLLSNYTDLWMLYIGLLFVCTVVFLPRGFAGLLMMHKLPWQQRRLSSLVLPYVQTGLPALVCLLSSIALIELGHSREQSLHFLGLSLAADSVIIWGSLLALAGASAFFTRQSLPSLRSAWERANGSASGEANVP